MPKVKDEYLQKQSGTNIECRTPGVSGEACLSHYDAGCYN